MHYHLLGLRWFLRVHSGFSQTTKIQKMIFFLKFMEKKALHTSLNVFIGFAIVDNLRRTTLSVFLYRSVKKKKLIFKVKSFLYFAFSRYQFFRF
jgi:hypothetical protein